MRYENPFPSPETRPSVAFSHCSFKNFVLCCCMQSINSVALLHKSIVEYDIACSSFVWTMQDVSRTSLGVLLKYMQEGVKLRKM